MSNSKITKQVGTKAKAILCPEITALIKTETKEPKLIIRQIIEGSEKPVAKVKKVLEIKNHAHCQGATNVPGRRMTPS